MDWRKKRLALGELLIFSGHKREDAPLTQGVALMLSKTAQRAFIGWEAHGPRFLVLTAEQTNVNQTICHPVLCTN